MCQSNEQLRIEVMCDSSLFKFKQIISFGNFEIGLLLYI